MQLTLGFSPCPNDTFIFYALLHGKIDTRGLTFKPYIRDVEQLNQMAIMNELDISKISFGAFLQVQKNYLLLTSGSALGSNCGPLLISKKKIAPAAMNNRSVAVPGIHTTANFLFDTFFPQHGVKTTMIFSGIEDAIINEIAETGVIIHENRFTYAQKGLVKLIDLGEYWETATGLPIPLGGIVVRRDLPPEIHQKVNRVMRRSVEYAFSNPAGVMPFVRAHAQAMEDTVMQAHIGLYVTRYTADLGTAGRSAILEMFRSAREKQIIPDYNKYFFIN